MSPFIAYLLGLLTVFLILVPFWTLSIINNDVAEVYKSSICYKVCDPNPGLS